MFGKIGKHGNFKMGNPGDGLKKTVNKVMMGAALVSGAMDTKSIAHGKSVKYDKMYSQVEGLRRNENRELQKSKRKW